MGRAKSPTKKTAIKTSSDARSFEQTTASTKSKEAKSSKIKSPGIPAKKSGKPSDKTSSIKESPRKNSGAAKIEPPEVAEPGEIMSPEEAEQARKRYLLERFWISGRGFWGKRGDRIAWIASVGLLLLIIFFALSLPL